MTEAVEYLSLVIVKQRLSKTILKKISYVIGNRAKGNAVFVFNSEQIFSTVHKARIAVAAPRDYEHHNV